MKDILKRIRNKKISWLSFLFCFISLVFFDFSFRYFYMHVTEVDWLNENAVWFTLGWALLQTALFALLPGLLRRIAMILSGLFYGVLVLVHAGMYSVFGSFFSFSSLSFAGDGAAFFSWEYIIIRKLVIVCVVVAFLMMLAAAMITPRYAKGKQQVWVRVGALLVATASVLIIYAQHTTFEKKGDAMGWDNRYVESTSSREAVYTEFKDLNICMYYAGLYQYTFRDVCISLGIDDTALSNRELEEYFEERATQISGDNEMTGVLKGKNVIMIMLESIDTWMLRPEYMPNLWKLQQEGVNFSNHYTPLYLYAGTFNTEIISMTGQIPSATNLPSSAYVENSFPISLPNLFKEQGYITNSYHSSNPHIYNRGLIHANLGLDRYWNHTDMGMGDHRLDSHMLNGYENMVFDDAFFDFIITYSGHGPYEIDDTLITVYHLEEAKKAVEQVGIAIENEDTRNQYIAAISHAMQTDEFIGGLVQRLEEDGRLDDTVLFFYSDHYGKYLTDTEFVKSLKGVGAENEEEIYHTPCFLYSTSLEPMTITKYTSSVDIAPTIANLFDLDVDRKYYIGDDVFGDKGGFVMMPNYSWFDAQTTALESQKSSEKTVGERNADVYKRINMSMNTYKNDFFASWK